MFDYASFLGLIPLLVIVVIIITVLIHLKEAPSPKFIASIIIGVILFGGVLLPTISHSGPADKNSVDVYIIAGQSNSAYGYYDLETSEPKLGEGQAYFYGTSEKPLFYGGHDYPSYDTTFESYDIQSTSQYLAHFEGPFSKIYYEHTGHKVLTINVGLNGSSISEWQPGATAYNYAYAAMQDAISKIPANWDVSFKGLIWIQGESDGSTPVEEYKSKWLTMFSGLFEPIGIKDAFISLTRSYGPVGYSTNKILPQQAQRELADEYTYIHLATSIANDFYYTTGTMELDNVHYTQLGHNLLGAALAEYCASFYN